MWGPRLLLLIIVMTYPKNNKLFRWFFSRYIKALIRRNFQAVYFNSIKIDSEKSVLLVANHFSWWDGFILYYLNDKLLKKKFHIIVLKETMKKVKFFKYLGAFSVNKNSRSVLQTLNYAAQLLNEPSNLVVIFPQGKLYSNFVTKVNFEKGIMKVLEQVNDKFQLVTAVTFVEYLRHKKPSANVYLQTIPPTKFENITELNDIYQQHYNTAQQQQTEIVL